MPVSALMPWRRPVPSGEVNKYLFLLVFLFFVLWLPATVLAQAAKVVDVRGTSLVERAGAAPRILGAGEPLDARDTISVARDSWAILEFSDQTRVTLRPNTVFRLDSYKADAPEAMLMGLVKGGLRVVTGLFGKRNPQGVRVQTAVATIGIRGTEFDARLCEDDCAAEEKAGPAPRPAVLPVARVVEMNGVVGAGRTGEAVRLLVPGAMLNEGDAVATGRNGNAVLVFRDGAQVALVANSRFAINRFRYNEASPRSGSAFLTLYAGNALVTTGQLARISPDAFLFRTALGVVRPFGTTFSGGGCVGSFCASGSVTVNSDGASASGSASGGGASASGTASAGTGGASASGTASAGSKTVSGSTGTLPPLTSGMAGAPSAQQVMNEVINGVNQVVVEVLNTATTQGQNIQQQANNLGTGAQNQLQEATQNASAALVNQAVNALNAATAPIVAEMTALMTQMRNNPPQTESASQQISIRMSQLSQTFTNAMNQALVGAGAVAQTDAFRAAYGLAIAEQLTVHSVMGATMLATPGLGGAGAMHQILYDNEISRILADPYALGSIGLVGLSAADLVEARNARVFGGSAVIQREIALYLTTQGSAAAKSFFNEAQATAVAAQQRAEQETAAARAAAEAAKAAADAKLAAARKVAEEKAAADKQLAAQKLAAAKALADAQAQAAAVAAQKLAEEKAAAARAAVEAELAAIKRGEIRVGGMRLILRDAHCVGTGDCRIIVSVPASPAPPVPVPLPNTPFTNPYIEKYTVTYDELERNRRERDQQADTGQPSAGDPDQPSFYNIATVAVWEGSVEVIGKGRLARGEMLAPNGDRLRMATSDIPGVKLEPDSFTGGNKSAEPGLYVWVRDGAVQMTKDDQVVDVSAGNAAVATKDRVRLLDAVPNFMRFDLTPLPNLSLTAKLDAFRLPDGALQNMCVIR